MLKMTQWKNIIYFNSNIVRLIETKNTIERSYPILWLEPGTFGASRTSPGSTRIQSFSMGFNIYIVDRLMKGDVNFDDILSDTNFIMQSIITYIDQSEEFRQLGINTEGNPIWNVITEGGNDNYAGYKANLVLRMPNTLSPCKIPNK